MNADVDSPKPIHHVEHVMGMPVSFDIRPPTPPIASILDATQWLHHVDATFSTYRDDSIITRFGRGELTIEQLTEEVRFILDECRRLGEVTNGAFDAFSVPTTTGTTLDPSGLVKGWAIQVAAEMLSAAGAVNFCINAAGDIALGGSPEPGRPWNIGIRHPYLPDMLATSLRLSGPAAVATSANYERGEHIIDPRTGSPAELLLSATVTGPDLGVADAYATAVFVMGLDGLEWIASQDGYEAYVITATDMTQWSDGFSEMWNTNDVQTSPT